MAATKQKAATTMPTAAEVIAQAVETLQTLEMLLSQFAELEEMTEGPHQRVARRRWGGS